MGPHAALDSDRTSARVEEPDPLEPPLAVTVDRQGQVAVAVELQEAERGSGRRVREEEGDGAVGEALDEPPGRLRPSSLEALDEGLDPDRIVGADLRAVQQGDQLGAEPPSQSRVAGALLTLG